MTEQEKQLIEDLITEKTPGFYARQAGRDFVAAIEAKLSPKHPPAGAICEVWDETDLNTHYIRVATGDGGFVNGGRKEPGWDRTTYDHYREIPTAEDALEAIKDLDRIPGGEPPWIRCCNTTKSLINELINNAMEG